MGDLDQRKAQDIFYFWQCINNMLIDAMKSGGCSSHFHKDEMTVHWITVHKDDVDLEE